MAIPKKYARPVTVDGTAFRWRVRRKPTYCQGNGWGPMAFAVEQVDLFDWDGADLFGPYTFTLFLAFRASPAEVTVRARDSVFPPTLGQ
ncbi:hypothetical protein AB0K05_01585 [Nonomuraea sp. NPDC049486]|uniref:hypothetical protein n=1 Tax=Nonomuraea sp. NPDC049486 TaxID=3155773 RepID=UPI00343E842E